MCHIVGDVDLPVSVRAKYNLWQERILKHAASSKDKEVVQIMQDMEDTMAGEDREGEGEQ